MRFFAIFILFLLAPAVLHVDQAQAQGVYPDIGPREIPVAPIIQPGQELKPGVIFRDCEVCPEMVVIRLAFF